MSVYIIAHKRYNNNIIHDNYKNLLVGAYKGHKFGDVYDDIGDNISNKNNYYCELTGMYWIWKNQSDDFVGIVHYRRFFSHDFKGIKTLSEKEIKAILRRNDIILPFFQKYHMTVKEHFCMECGLEKDIYRVREIIKNKQPEYLNAFDYVMESDGIYLFNMIICRKNIFDDYCKWLFSILFDLENMINLADYNDYQKRIYGFISERLIRVWVLHNNLKTFEVGVIQPEMKTRGIKKYLTSIKRTWLYYLQLSGYHLHH